MAVILQFPSRVDLAREISLNNASNNATREANNIFFWMEEHPKNVERILSTKSTEILHMTKEDLWQFLFYEIFERVRILRDITENHLNFLLAIKYFTDLIQEMVLHENPEWYITNHMLGEARKTVDMDGNLKNPERAAGDTAVFGYMFLGQKRKNQMNPKDYMDMAMGSYYGWSQRQPQHVGYIVAEHIPVILPSIAAFPQDMMRRLK